MNSTTTVTSAKKIQKAFSVLNAMLHFSAIWSPKQAYIPNCASFDFIIIGGGTAGSVIANRLTENENAKVLLFDAGGDPPIESMFPGLVIFLKNSKFDWKYAAENDYYSLQFHKPYKHGKEIISGKMLGGGSSLNYMYYTRGNYKVYDDWAAITKDCSWNWQNVLPYFIKSEKLLDPTILNSPDGLYHGTNGYLKVTKVYRKQAAKYLNAFAELGNNIHLDTNGRWCMGYSEGMVTIADDVRQSTAYSFLRPIKKRHNLFVLKDTLVSKILFDEYRNAKGVEVILKNNRTVQYLAEKEVIVSAGAFNTPQLLMLSGIGPEQHLRDIGVEFLLDLPVGQTLQDHVMVLTTHALNSSTKLAPLDFVGYPHDALIIGYAALNKTQNYPDYQTVNMLLNDPSQVLILCSFYLSYLDEICDALYRESIGKDVLFSLITLINPNSQGKIFLRSSDVRDNPRIYNGYYSNKKDLENHAKYLEHFMRIYETRVFKNSGAQFIVPKACGCGNKFDHKFWVCYALCLMNSGAHYSGSCPMGRVVDSRLHVYGVKKLRVADASVMPRIPAANTMAATIMVAEKAADMIKEDHYSSKL